MLECLGNEPCHFILIFDNGYFSEFGTFSITRLDRPHPQAPAGEEFRLARVDLRRLSQGRGVFRPRGDAAAGTPAEPLQGWKLPPQTHKYRLLAQAPHGVLQAGAGNGGSTLRIFAISKTITGVILDLEPGALRELHWHPTADEWQYVLEGNVSVTMFGSHGRYRIETLDEGGRRLHSARLWPLDRERGQEAVPRPDRVQHRTLRGDRPVAMDRRQSG